MAERGARWKNGRIRQKFEGFCLRSQPLAKDSLWRSVHESTTGSSFMVVEMPPFVSTPDASAGNDPHGVATFVDCCTRSPKPRQRTSATNRKHPTEIRKTPRRAYSGCVIEGPLC